MAKKFVRSITGIENINEQDMDTNNVGDLLSDGQDIYVHRKTPTGDEYFNLTKENTKLIADGDSGLEIWKKDGEDAKRIKLSQEFLKNNAQYISAKENSGLKATQRQDKYGKSYELDFTDEAKAKIQDVVDKVNKIPQGGGKSKSIKVKPAPTPISADEAVDVLTVTETDDSVTLGLTNNVLTMANFRGGTDSTLAGNYITLEETTWSDLDENFMDVTRHGWGLDINENYWASRRNMTTVKGSGILLKEETELAGLNLESPDITFDIDSSKLLRHDCLLGDETKGIKVWHTDGESTSAISLTDDVLAKIKKIDSLSAGGTATPTQVVGDGDTITVEDNLDGEKVVALKPSVKADVQKIQGLESRVSHLEEDNPNIGAGTQKTIVSSDGSVTVSTTENNVDLSVNISSIATDIDNKVNVAMVPEIDNLKTLIEGTTVEAPLTKSYNQTPKGRTVNLALAESAKNKINKVDTIENNVTELTEKVEGLQPVFKNINVNGIRGSLFAIPYGGMGNYLATISLQTTAIDSNAPVKIPRSHEVSKWLNNMNLPSPGYLQSGSVLIRKESSGGVEVRTSGSMDALYYHGVFQVVLSSL